MSAASIERPRIRLWMKLAVIAVAGVLAMHVVYMLVGKRIATQALAREQALLGRSIADLLVDDVTDPLLVGDFVKLTEIVHAATARASGSIAYCFVVQNGRVVASSADASMSEALLRARPGGTAVPIVIDRGHDRILDLVHPVPARGSPELRIGFTMAVLDQARYDLAKELGLLAVAILFVGVLFAFVIGQGIRRAADEMLMAADQFDPAHGHDFRGITATGSDEIATLAAGLNRMMARLKSTHAEKERVRLRSVQTQKLLAIGSLTAAVAHEVNNPLAGLLNCVQRLERSELPEPRRREYLAHMRAGLERIGSVVQRLLDFGRARPLSLGNVEVACLAGDAIQLAAPIFAERDVKCSLVEEPGAAGVVHADPHEIGQAILNLLLNAAYVTHDGGMLRVRLRARGKLRGIAVEDEGPGIPEELRERVLDPFFTTKPEGEGTGLGLSVTRSIVDAHGGELTFEFPEAGGTVATLWLRAVEAQEQRVAI